MSKSSSWPIKPKLNGYSGVLGEPNRTPERMVEWLDPKRRSDLQDWLLAREQALFSHFGIENDEDPDRWRKLAYSLACAHVPAYKEKRGRPKANRFVDQGLARLLEVVLDFRPVCSLVKMDQGLI